jgi:DNA-binding MarR family transcriptional regulator
MVNVPVSRSQLKHDSPDVAILAGQLLFALQDEMFGRLAADGHPDIRPRHGAVLAYLDEAGTRATELAALSGRHKQVVGTLVDELEALGYVERLADPDDRRAKLIVPTPRGIDQMVKSDAIMREVEARFARILPDGDFDAFKSALRTIVAQQEKQEWRQQHVTVRGAAGKPNPVG